MGLLRTRGCDGAAHVWGACEGDDAITVQHSHDNSPVALGPLEANLLVCVVRERPAVSSACLCECGN